MITFFDKIILVFKRNNQNYPQKVQLIFTAFQAFSLNTDNVNPGLDRRLHVFQKHLRESFSSFSSNARDNCSKVQLYNHVENW